MKDKIFKIVAGLFLVCSAIATYAQTQQQEMHDKYWFYRYRLTQEFLKKGLGTCGVPNGYSIPGSYAYGGGTGGSDTPDLKFGDGTSFLGNYIGVLAVELKLMLFNGASQDQLNRVKEELYFAMKAYERLDKQAEVILLPYQSDCNNSLNGFFMRDDIGYNNFLFDFKTPFQPDGVTPKRLTSDFEKSRYLDPCDQNEYRYPSMDQISNLLVGFSLVVKSIPYESYLEANGNAYHYDNMAKFYADKIAHYLTVNNYKMPIPNTDCAAEHSGIESLPLSYGVAYAADKIRNGDFGGDPVVCWGQCMPSNNPYTASPVVEGFAGMWQNFFNYPSGKTYVLNNYNERLGGHQNNNAVFMQFAAVGNLFRAGLMAEHSKIGIPILPVSVEVGWHCETEDFFHNCIFGWPEIETVWLNVDVDIYCYNNNLGNQLGGYITNFLFDHAARADLFSYLPIMCVPFAPLPEFSVNTTSTALSEYGEMMDGQYFPLLHQYLHDCGPYTYDEWNLYNKLLDAPCSGPHYKPIKDINNPPPIGLDGRPNWNVPSTSTGKLGWYTENRWEKSNAALNPPSSSASNGIDYMIAYNLFHSVKGNSYNFSHYEDYIYREVRNKTFNAPSNKTLVGFEKLLLANTTINTGTTTVLHAGTSIKFSPGVVIKNGATLSTKIDPVFACNIPNSNSTYAKVASNPVMQPKPKENGEEILKAAVTEQMKNYNNEFQKALVDHNEAIAYKCIDKYVSKAKATYGESEISLFPNPATSKLFLKKSQYESSELSIEIMDLVGKIKLNSNQYISDNAETVELDISELVSGYYLCKVTCGSYSKTIQFIKK